MAIVFGHEIHIFIPSFGQNLENIDNNKEKLTAKFAKMAKTFSILYVFYAFALSDSNDADRNLNWRNVKQMVPTRFGIREGLIALQEFALAAWLQE